MMDLDGRQRHQLHDALLSAFPTRPTLEQMVDYGLDENLNKIAGNSNLTDAVFELIRWAKARDRIEELIRTALRFNSRNAKLCEFASQVGIAVDIPSQDTTQSPKSGTQQFISRPFPSPRPALSTSVAVSKDEEFDVFISYSHQDQKWVREWLVPYLQQAMLKVCVDYESFRPGMPIVQAIEQAVQNSRKTLLVISPDYLKSEWGEFENILVQTLSPAAYSVRLIPLLRQYRDEQDIPLRIKSLLWVDFTQPSELGFQFQRLLAVIRDEPLPQWKSGTAQLPEAPQTAITCEVVPLEAKLPSQDPPAYLTLPPGYRYLGKLESLTTEHLYREQDGHVVLWFPPQPGIFSSFLVDKYAVTAQQACMFLNDVMGRGLVGVDHLTRNGVTCCVDKRGRLLVLDAQDQWRQLPMQSRPASPWGITYQNAKWQPIAGCELLPATLISWWGARLYSLWAHRQSVELADQHVAYLPTSGQWQLAALFDPTVKRQQLYPWGDIWERNLVNYAGYWADYEVPGPESLERWRINQPDTHKHIRPLPVSSLLEGRSPIGCVQLLGNVWEWTADAPPDNSSKRIIRGGACNVPQEYCMPDYVVTWPAERANEYIGFRCVFPL